MKLKGFIKNININHNFETIQEFGLPEYKIGTGTTAEVDIVFIEGDFSELLNVMGNGEPVEIDFPEKGVAKKGTKDASVCENPSGETCHRDIKCKDCVWYSKNIAYRSKKESKWRLIRL